MKPAAHDPLPYFHLVPVESDWGVRQDGGRYYTCIYREQQAALRVAQRLALAHKTLLLVHDHTGHVDQTFDYRHGNPEARG